MSRKAAMEAANRFFARLEAFECECPKCGNLVKTVLESVDDPHAKKSMQDKGVKRRLARLRPNSQAVKNFIWNPYMQVLRCPYCNSYFSAGLLLYSHQSQVKPRTPPPDTVPTRRQNLEIRGRAKGFWKERLIKEGDSVNDFITEECTCEWDRLDHACPVHGDVLRWQEPVKTPRLKIWEEP